MIDEEAAHWGEIPQSGVPPVGAPPPDDFEAVLGDTGARPAAPADPVGEDAAAAILREMLVAGESGDTIREAGRQLGFDVEPVLEAAAADQMAHARELGAKDRQLRRIASHYGYDPEPIMEGLRSERSFARNVGDLALEAAGGVTGTAANLAGTPGILADLSGVPDAANLPLRLSRYLQGLDPQTAQAGTTAGDVAQGLGSAALYMTTGGAGRAAGLSSSQAIGLTGSVSSFAPGYWDARAHGAGEITALASGLLNGLVGYSEAYPMARILDRAMAGQGGRALRYMLTEGTEELLQSSGQQLAGNAIAKVLYDEDRQYLEGVLAAGKAGFLTGAIASALGTGAARLVGAQEGAGRGQPAGEARRPEGGPPAPVAPQGGAQAQPGTEVALAGRPVMPRPVAQGRVQPGQQAQIEGPAGSEPVQDQADQAPAAPAVTRDQAGARLEAIARDPEPLADAVGADPDRVQKLAQRMLAMGPEAASVRLQEVYAGAGDDTPLVDALHEALTGQSVSALLDAQKVKQRFAGSPEYEGPAPMIEAVPDVPQEAAGGVARMGTMPGDDSPQRTAFLRGMRLLRRQRADGEITPAQFDAGVQALFGVTPDVEDAAGLDVAPGAASGPSLKLPRRPKMGGARTGAVSIPSGGNDAESEGRQQLAAEAVQRDYPDVTTALRKMQSAEKSLLLGARVDAVRALVDAGFEEGDAVSWINRGRVSGELERGEYMDALQRMDPEAHTTLQEAMADYSSAKAEWEQKVDAALKTELTAARAAEGLRIPKRPKPGGSKTGAISLPKPTPSTMQSDESRIESARRLIQDRFVTLRRREAKAPNKGSEFSDAEVLLHGRAAAKQRELQRAQDEAVQIMRDTGTTPRQVADYMSARHAAARDALIIKRRAKEIVEARAAKLKEKAAELERAAGKGAKVTPELARIQKRIATMQADAIAQATRERPHGSGVDPAKAQAVLATATPALKKLAAIHDRVRDNALDFRVQAGLISQAQANAWKREFGPTYTPLKTIDEADERIRGAGRSLNTRGPEAKRARGRETEADDPFASMFQDAQEAILRGERNIVGQEFGKLAERNPDPALWDAPQPGEASGEDVFNYKVDGESFHVRVHDEGTLKALKNLDPVQVNKLLRLAAEGARLMSGLHTSRNPEFILGNLTRDLQTAGLNISAEKSAKLGATVVKNAIPALRRIYRELRAPGTGGKYAGEYIANGAMTDWISPESIQARVASIEKRANEIPLRKKLREFGQILNDASGAVENGPRLAYYEALREAGVPAPKAAVAAKELSVNWSKKGEWGPFANTLFLFFSAQVNGTVRFGEALARNPKRAAGVAGALVAAGYLTALIGDALAGEDELDGERWIEKQNEHNWRNYAMLVLPDGSQAKLPLAPGWGTFYYWGGLAYRKQGSFGDALAGLVEQFSPIKGATVGQVVSPWFTDPFVEVSENRDFADRRIYPEAYPGETTPEYQRTQRATGLSVALSKFASEMFGGTPARRGDVEIPPDALDHLSAESVGGLGRFTQRVFKTAGSILEGKAPLWRDVPIANKFRGDAPNTYLRQFREDREAIDVEAAAERAGEKYDATVLDFLTEARATDRIARQLVLDGDRAGAEREYAEFHKRFKKAQKENVR